MSRSTLPSRWVFSIRRTLSRRIDPREEVLQTAALFGLETESREAIYPRLKIAIRPGEILAVTGPSGSGKSLLLEEIARKVPDAIRLNPSSLGRSEKPPVAFLRGMEWSRRMELLSRCGLAEATAMVTPARHLSGGQRYRLALARALHVAHRRGRPALILADEFASTLDEITAAVLASQLRKWVSRHPIALVAAIPHGRILNSLQPDRTLLKPLGQPPRWMEAPPKEKTITPKRWPIVPGRIGDYDTLGGWHYMGGRPAAHKRIWKVSVPAALTCQGTPETAAVLVVSPPLSACRGRNLATDNRYAGPDRQSSVDLLNREMECISRVIVHPMFRGCGLAVRLVRHALATAATPWAEALAAMGAIHPFFENAGMAAYPLSGDPYSARWMGAVQAVGLRQQDVLAVEPIRRLLSRKSDQAAFLRHELEIALKNMFSVAQRSRQCDPLAEVCRRSGRQYVYYLAPRSV
jgi:ABC-type lipoprotein export system ATPase subunit/GNAT superfamily N-acetyltransferase